MLFKPYLRKTLYLLPLILIGLICLGQEKIITPLDGLESHAKEIELLTSFHKFKKNLKTLIRKKEYSEALNQILEIQKYPKPYEYQIAESLMEVYLNLGKKKEIKKLICGYIQTTLWKKHITISILLPNKFKDYDNYNFALAFLNEKYDMFFNKRINKEKNLVNKIFWINAINQRDQDYRRHLTFNSTLDDSCATSTLNYFDSENLKSIKSYIENYKYPKFIMGAKHINLSILHYNQPVLFTVQEFNWIAPLIWTSVIEGITSLSDYCYIVDRYLVMNQKTEELFGLVVSPHSKCNHCYSNSLKIGLIR